MEVRLIYIDLLSRDKDRVQQFGLLHHQTLINKAHLMIMLSVEILRGWNRAKYESDRVSELPKDLKNQ